MGMGVRISTSLLQQLRRAAEAHPEQEVCGLLLGRDDRVEAAQAAANVSAAPRSAFEIDPATLLQAHRRARMSGEHRILGYYHSHPSGDADPSPRDAAQAAPDGMLWLILAAGEARLWRSVRGGAVHDRFNPVPISAEQG